MTDKEGSPQEPGNQVTGLSTFTPKEAAWLRNVFSRFEAPFIRWNEVFAQKQAEKQLASQMTENGSNLAEIRQAVAESKVGKSEKKSGCGCCGLAGCAGCLGSCVSSPVKFAVEKPKTSLACCGVLATGAIGLAACGGIGLIEAVVRTVQP